MTDTPAKRPFTFYIDETGNRHPDKKADASRLGRDWFGLGGVLIRGEDSEAARVAVDDFASNWKLRGPAHLTDMMAEKKAFSWLGRITQEERDRFWDDWRSVLIKSNVIGLACVVDRPGYVERGYLEKHKDKWLLCRSAFDIVVERAAKIARHEGRKLHVVFEQDPGINDTMTGYFRNLKENGLAFDAGTSEKYKPLSKEAFAETLGRIDHKPKAHNLLQLADSYVYAMARYGYEKKFPLYRHLRDRSRIADFALPEECLPHMGVKYYCFR
jgi:hypothetical protein